MNLDNSLFEFTWVPEIWVKAIDWWPWLGQTKSHGTSSIIWRPAILAVFVWKKGLLLQFRQIIWLLYAQTLSHSIGDAYVAESPKKTSLERRQRMTGFPTRISLANMRKLIKKDSDTSVPTENFDRSLLIKTGLRSKAPTGAALLDGIRFSNTAYHHVLSLSYWSICIPIANGQRKLGGKDFSCA